MTEITKMYYSIGEVSEITGIEPHVLRYWETEFRELTPRKNRGGKRLYRQADIDIVSRIKELLYDERYTIEGARRKLAESKQDAAHDSKPFSDGLRILNEVKQGLENIRDLLRS